MLEAQRAQQERFRMARIEEAPVPETMLAAASGDDNVQEEEDGPRHHTGVVIGNMVEISSRSRSSTGMHGGRGSGNNPNDSIRNSVLAADHPTAINEAIRQTLYSQGSTNSNEDQRVQDSVDPAARLDFSALSTAGARNSTATTTDRQEDSDLITGVLQDSKQSTPSRRSDNRQLSQQQQASDRASTAPASVTSLTKPGGATTIVEYNNTTKEGSSMIDSTSSSTAKAMRPSTTNGISSAIAASGRRSSSNNNQRDGNLDDDRGNDGGLSPMKSKTAAALVASMYDSQQSATSVKRNNLVGSVASSHRGDISAEYSLELNEIDDNSEAGKIQKQDTYDSENQQAQEFGDDQVAEESQVIDDADGQYTTTLDQTIKSQGSANRSTGKLDGILTNSLSQAYSEDFEHENGDETSEIPDASMYRTKSYENASFDASGRRKMEDGEEVGEDADMVVGVDASVIHHHHEPPQNQQQRAANSNHSSRGSGGTAAAADSGSSANANESVIKEGIRRPLYARPIKEEVDFWHKMDIIVSNLSSEILPSKLVNMLSLSEISYRLEYLCTEFTALWLQVYQDIQYQASPPGDSSVNLIDPWLLASIMVGAVKLCRRALVSSILLLNRIMGKLSPQFLINFGSSQQDNVEMEIDASMLLPSLSICTAFCKLVPSLISLCESLGRNIGKYSDVGMNKPPGMAPTPPPLPLSPRDRTSTTTSSSSIYAAKVDYSLPIVDAYRQVLAECGALLAPLIYLPTEDELRTSQELGVAISAAAATMSTRETEVSRHGAREEGEEEQLESSFSALGIEVLGLSMSDRWCLVTLLSDMLKNCRGYDSSTDLRERISKQVILSAHSVLTAAPLDMFNMLVAQQLPSTLCDFLHSGVISSRSASHAGTGARAGGQERQGRCSGVQLLSQSPVLVPLALVCLVSPSAQLEWTRASPLPLGGAVRKDAEPVDFERSSSHLMLRQRICSAINDKLCDGSRHLLENLLYIFTEMCSVSQTTIASQDRSAAMSVRNSILVILLYLTSGESGAAKTLCASVVRYESGAVIRCLLSCLEATEAVPASAGNKESVEGEEGLQLLEVVAHYHSCCLRILSNLVSNEVLKYAHLIEITNVTIQCCVSTSCSQYNASKISAGFALLGELYGLVRFISARASASATTVDEGLGGGGGCDGDDSMHHSDSHGVHPQSKVDVSDSRKLLAMISKAAVATQVLQALKDVLAHFVKRGASDPVNKGENGPQASNAHGSSAIMVGSEYGVRTSGQLDGLCNCLSVIATAIVSPQEAAFAESRAFFQSDTAIHLYELLCRLIFQSGCGEISPLGVMSAMKFIAAFFCCRRRMQMETCLPTVDNNVQHHHHDLRSKHGAADSSRATRRPGNVVSVPFLARREGVITMISQLIAPMHLEQSNMWALVTISTQHSSGGSKRAGPLQLRGMQGYGALVGKFLESCCVTLRCILGAVVSGEASNATGGGVKATGPAAGGSGETTVQEDAQAALEAVYRSHLLVRLVEACRNYSNNLSGRCVAAAANVFSELVLSSSKFLAQFVDAEGLQVLDELPIGIFTGGSGSGGLRLEGGEEGGEGDVEDDDDRFDRDCDEAAEEHGEEWSEYVDKQGLDRAHAMSRAVCYRSEALINALQLSSQLARNSEKFFPMLSSIFTATKLTWILTQSSHVARAKCCNLIGNLCRHSGNFYPVLASPVEIIHLPRSTGNSAIARTAASAAAKGISQSHRIRRGDEPTMITVLAILASYCADEDSATRKFASFAVGNAAFHSKELYDYLAASIRPLSVALKDSDEKTRANAAGAIGNLIRNGGGLSGLMAEQGIVAMLVEIVLNDSDTTPQRIALFSLGTMAVYPATRNAILTMPGWSIHQLVQAVKEKHAKDEMIQKYLLRLRQKLKTAATTSTPAG